MRPLLFSAFDKKVFRRLALVPTALAVTALAAMAAMTVPAHAEQPVTSLATLLDRTQIEDLLVDYYGQLGSGGKDFGDFYVEDGVLDVNGLVAQGQKGIEDLYKKTAEGTPQRPGTFRMMLTNIKIVVNGATATADVLWTGVNSETAKAAPQVIEQGREHDALVKRNGRWLFKHRVITSDGGLPPMFEKTYKAR